MCEESSSFELSSSDLASCLQDINKCLRLKRKKRESLVGEVGQCTGSKGNFSISATSLLL